MDEAALRRLIEDELTHQDGVVTRAQLEAAGAQPHDVRRLVRRRALARVHRGVFVDHTGGLTWRQRTWAAVLACGPGAALCRGSWEEGPVVHVAIDTDRRIQAPDGVRPHRVRGLEAMVRWAASPPRVRPEHDVLLRTAAARDDDEVVELLAAAVRTRATTVAAIRTAVADRSRLARRRLVLAVLDDIELGTQSVLEHRYLRDVERAHGLPTAVWQHRRVVDGRTEYADALYDRFDVLVELRGRLGHDSWGDRAADARRDLRQLGEGRLTVELVHRQVFREACRTADALAALLRRQGWEGAATSCRRPGCVIAEGSGQLVARTLPTEAG